MGRMKTRTKWKKQGVLKSKLALITGLSAQGLSQLKIATAIGIHEATFQKLLEEEEDVKHAFMVGRNGIGAMVRGTRIAMACDDESNVPPELREKMLRQLEKQYNNYIVEDEQQNNAASPVINFDMGDFVDKNGNWKK